MLDYWQEALTLVTSALVLAAIVGAGVFWARGSYNKARIEAFEQDLAAADRRDQRRQEELAEAKADIARLTQRVSHLEQDNRRLEELATNRGKIEELEVEVRKVVRVISSHHTEAMRGLDILGNKLDGLGDRLHLVEEAVAHG